MPVTIAEDSRGQHPWAEEEGLKRGVLLWPKKISVLVALFASIQFV